MSDPYLAIGPGVEWQTVEDSVLVLHDDLLHNLTGSSAEIWRAIDGSMRASDIAALLSARHPESTQVSEDVGQFVGELARRGLLVHLERPTGTRCRVPEHVAWVPEDDGSVALADLRTGQRHSLTPTGGLIWTLALSGLDRDLMEEEIFERFPDAPPGHAQEIDRVLDSLVAEGLLEPRRYDSPASA